MRSSLIGGIRDGIPGGIMLLLTFSVVGAAAAHSGVSLTQSLALTFFVFAAPAQLVIYDLLQSGASLSTIIVSVALINLRFAFMAIALRRLFGNLKSRLLIPGALMLTATTFALTSIKMQSKDAPSHGIAYFVGIGIAALSLSLMGALFGQAVLNVMPHQLRAAAPLIASIFLLSKLAAGSRSNLNLCIAGMVLTMILRPLAGNLAFVAAALFVASTATAFQLPQLARRLVWTKQ